RFCAVVALGELRALHGGQPLPGDLLRELRPLVERPTFGQWKDLLALLVRHLPASPPLVVPELPRLLRDRLLPALSGEGEPLPERFLLPLRNLLAHGGAMSRARADYFLTGEPPGAAPGAERFAGWSAWLEGLAGHLSLLAGTEVYFF